MLLVPTEFSRNATVTYMEREDCPLFCLEFCQDLLPVSGHEQCNRSWCLSHPHQDHLGPSASVAFMFPVAPPLGHVTLQQSAYAFSS